MRHLKRILIVAISLIIVALLAIVFCDKKVIATANGKTYSDINLIPQNHVGLLLGTGKYLDNGHINSYYRYRIEAARKLLDGDKINYLIISGDNSRQEYNEPEMMRRDLIDSGIDSSRIYLDYAGFRTFDSMVRLKEIFSQNTVTVISQEFHNERALYIAQREGITAIGFNAQDVAVSAGKQVQFREKLARVKVFTDYLFNISPKFLGPKVEIPYKL